MPPEFAIRLLAAADLAAYKRLRDAMLAAHEDAFTSDAQTERARAADSYAGRVEPPNYTFGAWQRTELVGAVSCECDLRPKVRHIGHLTGMMVAPLAQRRGVGRALLAAAIERARLPSLKFAQLTLSVTASNATARALYVQAGFVRYGTLPRAIRLDGRWLDKDLMVLPLK